jgi:hypothetical protein
MVQPCRDAIARAEQHYATPAGLLTAIATVETGRKEARTGEVVPWPWSVNAENASYYFPTRSDAVAWVRAAQARGTTSIDVGCMQVNLLYHPEAFASVEEAFDPVHNADYAASFLVQLCSESGSWEQATGFYHSRTADLATGYLRQVAAVFSHVSAVMRDSLLLRSPPAGPLGTSQSAAPLNSQSALQSAWGATLSSLNAPLKRADKAGTVALAPMSLPKPVTTVPQASRAQTPRGSAKVLPQSARVFAISTSGKDDGRTQAPQVLPDDLSLHSGSCWKTRVERSLGQVVAGG